MLPKTSTYIKRYDGQTKWMYFLIESDDFGIKSALISKKNLIASLSAIKSFENQNKIMKIIKIKFMVIFLQIFMIKNFLR